MVNISGFGLSAQVIASSTFPNGFQVTAFADDADPLDSPDLQAADTAFGLNGDMLIWSRPAGIEISINVIPDSPDDKNLYALLDANRVAKQKNGARDTVGIVFTYPSGQVVNTSKGAIISGPMLNQVASSGRLKTHMYRFRFEQISKTGN
jgi:hypothetical protein